MSAVVIGAPATLSSTPNAPATPAPTADDASEKHVDVCIIGAGAAGLMCARTLVRAGLSVVVLEGRSRVGGRTKTVPFGGGKVDLGAQWISPDQTESMHLIKELDLDKTLVRQQWFSKMRVTRSDPLMRSGAESGLKEEERNELRRIAFEMDAMAKALPDFDKPLDVDTRRKMKEYDGKSFLQFIEESIDPSLEEASRAEVHQELQLFCANTYASDAEQTSLLYALECIRSCGGLYKLGDGDGGAQTYTLEGGYGNVIERLGDQAAAEGKARFKLIKDQDVRTIHIENDVVHVEGSDTNVLARWAVVAFAPTLWGRVDFFPPLATEKRLLVGGMFCGSALKVFIAYDEPFWEGHKGNADVDLEDIGAISNLFPMKIGNDHGLVGLITASRASEMIQNAPKDIERRVLKQLYDYFDQDVRAFRCKHFMYKSWAGEKFSAGCYEAVAHPNCALSLLEHGPKIHAGRVSFACTELAREWSGFVDGALQSGSRAAQEAIAGLRGGAS